MAPTPEQQRIINHDPERHARVLAGPGTGKSWTSVAFLERLAADRPDLRTRMLTFTRAATAEFAEKLGDANLEGLGVTPPATVHAFALSVLMRSPVHGLPMPLRIPDRWELNALVEPALAKRLRAMGHDATVNTVRRLAREMAAGWESLDPEHVLLVDVTPALRAAYVGAWNGHRSRYGYVSVAELPYRAGKLMEDVSWNRNLDVLLVDEYQDLNEADIKLMRLVAATGVSILAIGDDDQSIYGFRNAAPQGIRRFLDEFGTDYDYSLSFCRRCGGRVLPAANEVISSAPDRGPKPPLSPLPEAPDSRIAYVRFATEEDEAEGVARMIRARIDTGIPAGRIAVLARTNIARWATALRPALEERHVPLASTEWVGEALNDEELRRGLAIGHLALNREDSLSWWTLLHLTPGVGQRFIEYIDDSAVAGETFAQTLLRLRVDEFSGGPRGRGIAAEMLTRIILKLDGLGDTVAPADEFGWGGWLLSILDDDRLGEPARRLLELVGDNVVPSEGLGGFLAQLQPLGNELAAKAEDGVRLMTITSSKGLTVDSAFVLGVEDGLIPKPDEDVNEERRLLYVAMTRATQVCVMTYVARRRSPIAYQGRTNLGNRRRCTLLEDLSIGNWTQGSDVAAILEEEAREGQRRRADEGSAE